VTRGKKHTAEQIVNFLRQVEVGVANGKTLPQACKEAEIVEQHTTADARSMAD
jgi:putative transposase